MFLAENILFFLAFDTIKKSLHMYILTKLAAALDCEGLNVQKVGAT